MSDPLDELRKAREEEFFTKLNAEALARLSLQKENKKRERLSPVTGKPMEQFTLMGVNIDRCPDSGGVWLDKGELEHIIKNSEAGHSGFHPIQFLKKIFA